MHHADHRASSAPAARASFHLVTGKIFAGIVLLCLVVALVSSALTWIVARAGIGAPVRAPGDDAYLRAWPPAWARSRPVW
ncbi:hypothetical protein ACU4HD_18850 [Cupriavidus basilensis]